jgi:hypothetical protein
MAAVTGTIVAGIGMGVSAAQAIGQNKAMKRAEEASKKATASLRAINEDNAFKQLQVPTLGTQLAQQSQAQREAQTMGMIQGAGAEGVIGSVGQLALAGEQGDLQNAARLDELKYERDAAQAQAQQGINARKQQRQYDIEMNEKQDAEMRRFQAEANRNEAIEGIFGFAAQGLESASKIKFKDKKTNATVPGIGSGNNYNRPFTAAQAAAGAYEGYQPFSLFVNS